jgi:hypothetical protein
VFKVSCTYTFLFKCIAYFRVNFTFLILR